MHGLHWYDNGARWMDPIFHRFTSIDPLAEKYYSISPYVVCGNNPFKYIDLDGREWSTPEDAALADMVYKEAEEMLEKLNKETEQWIKEMAKVKSNERMGDKKKQKRIEKLEEKQKDISIRKEFLTLLRDGIAQLGDSKIVYTFNTVEDERIIYFSSREDGTIIINNDGTIGSRTHELVHAIQYDNGAFRFDPLGSTDIIGIGVLLREIPVYVTEFSITEGKLPFSYSKRPRKAQDITPDWLFGIPYPGTNQSLYGQFQ